MTHTTTPAMSEVEFAWVGDANVEPASIYLGRAYQSMLAGHDGAESRLLKIHVGGQSAYLPILLKSLGNGCSEAYSAYGYGGLFGQLVLSDAHVEAMRAFLSRESVVCIFIRHSPFLRNELCWPDALTELNRRTYATALQPTKDFDDYLTHLPQKLRWSVNFARRAGLGVRFTPLSELSSSSLQTFYALYAGLMLQKQTSDYYLFSERFFQEHTHVLSKQCELAEIVDPATGDLMAGALFLIEEAGWAHYHLSAARPEAMKQQGMELLLASAIYRYGNHGMRGLHLGGGHLLDETDGLSRFKAKFSTERLAFFCTKLVCDEAAYRQERARLPLSKPNLFLVSDARG
jgi:hypothetical protein